ncbi:hypothetical protein MNBD_GAMMA09-2719 [hydrothermal vent metagenome]|uniref:Porin n=1 Tax=hydrothermal vent metagenome TaxID=652676 RepID=A0A3B0XUV0_9ZZZZ
MFYLQKNNIHRLKHRLRSGLPASALSLLLFLPPGIAYAGQTEGDSESLSNQQLLQQIKGLEQRVIELETTTVLSDPETRVKPVEVFVDENGLEHSTQVAGSKRRLTYQRERVYRRQTINEKIEEALDDAANRNVQIGVDAAIIMQNVQQTAGSDKTADGNFYQLASTDLYFTAGLAQYTVFFADIVGLSGTPPDAEINGLTLVNGYAARLDEQNDLSLREAWLMTELWDQKISLIVGRLDLTNYFDSNAAANDETQQFLSDALVNNPALGLSENGAGMALVYDPKSAFTFKLGYQQSTSTATNLSDSLFLLLEAGYQMNPFHIGEGNYRIWYREDNTGAGTYAAGISIDQKLLPGVTLFGRYGSAENLSSPDKDDYYSAGFQFNAGLGFNPEDVFGIGYARSELATLEKEKLFEAYYNLAMTEKMQLSFNLTYLDEKRMTADTDSYFISGVRLQASF